MWIHQHSEWPHFTWDANSLSNKLAEVRNRQGYLLGRMESLGFHLKQEAGMEMLTDEIVKSSAIEGEQLNPQEVRSSVARYLGVPVAGLIPSSRYVDGMVEMVLDATKNCHQPLTKERLFGWQAALFPTGRSGMQPITVGNWRTAYSGTMQVVSGPIGRETIHFEAPHADRLEQEMTSFLTWFESHDNSVDPVLKAGVAHLWFVTIHPFEDGNGRIARAITDMALARAESVPYRFYSLSAHMELERKDYYRYLEVQQRSTPEITQWLAWFVDCLGRAIASADDALGRVLLKARLWNIINQYSINERQRNIINRMLDHGFKGYMSTSKYAKMAKCSTDTALRDIQNLKAYGILIQNPGGGRSTSYSLQKMDVII